VKQVLCFFHGQFQWIPVCVLHKKQNKSNGVFQENEQVTINFMLKFWSDNVGDFITQEFKEYLVNIEIRHETSRSEFNYCKDIPHYYNNIFALQYAHIHNLYLDSKHT
jgi:hypothetical protein